MTRSKIIPLDPAANIIGLFDGPRAVARMLGVDVSNVHRWTYPKTKKGGTGGRIPPRYWQELLSHARARRIRLDIADFFDAEAA